MDGTAIIIILAIAGVASVLLFALKGLLDQVPDVIESAGRARDAWKHFRRAEQRRPAGTIKMAGTPDRPGDGSCPICPFAPDFTSLR